MAGINYTERIPNNVGLAENRRLQRALEDWQPKFLEWWKDMGPEGFQAKETYLRTAVSVDAQGWAHFDYVRMPEYRWGIFLAEPEANRVINFGDHMGQPAWQEVPGEYRGTLRRLIVTQGDTEPASVEQQRHLGRTCPSLYDLRNLFQVNVEEGRHLWAMVYLLDAHFGRDGREESEALLQRRSGDPDKPRILGAFNEETPDWLSFFLFCFFTDRDGKYQLASLAESGFDPLSRTCRFMLTEEAHHMFVGEAGVQRVVQRTCELMREHKTDDVRRWGGIDLATIQRYINFHCSVSLDLFGSEVSTNAANFYTTGLKGRFEETKKTDDHRLKDATYPVVELDRRADRHAGRAGAGLAERAPAGRLRGGLPARRRPLEQGDPRPRHRHHARAAPPRLPSGHRQLQRGPRVAGRARREPGRMGRATPRVAAHRRRPELRGEPDEERGRARQVRQLDRAARARHQRPARRLRVRATGLITEAGR